MRYLNHQICSWLAIGAASATSLNCSTTIAGGPFTEVSVAVGNYDTGTSPLGSPTIEIASFANSGQSESGGDSKVVTDIRQSLPSVAFPNGQVLNCQDIAQTIRSAQQSHCLEAALKQTLTCCNDGSCSNSLRQQLAHALASKIEDEKIRKGLTAHVVVYSTMMLARQHIEALDKLDTYERQQRVAMDNGIAIQDPSALKRIRIQTTDTAIQTISANKNTRAQLSILLKSNSACDYQPTLEACCVAPLQDLCELISVAEQNRPELQVMRILDAMLCEQTNESCNCCASILNSLHVVSAPCCIQSHGLVTKIFCKSKLESQTNSLRLLVQSSSQVVKDKIASEVTDAWHKAASSQARLMLAQETADAASERVSQLGKMSAEVSASPETLLDVDLALFKARGELVQREQDWQVALIELAYSTGCL